MDKGRRKILNATLVVVAIVALFFVPTLLKQKPVTRSENSRFDDWVRYFMSQEGYTVEYRSFDDFQNEVNVMRNLLQGNVFAASVKRSSLGPEFKGSETEVMCARTSGEYPVTVYYDDEKDVIFYKGTGTNPTWSYGYFYTF